MRNAEAEHLVEVSFCHIVSTVMSQGKPVCCDQQWRELCKTTMKWSLIEVKEETRDFQRSTICFALVLESDNRYKEEIEMGICICFENWEQNLLRVDIFSNRIIC